MRTSASSSRIRSASPTRRQSWSHASRSSKSGNASRVGSVQSRARQLGRRRRLHSSQRSRLRDSATLEPSRRSANWRRRTSEASAGLYVHQTHPQEQRAGSGRRRNQVKRLRRRRHDALAWQRGGVQLCSLTRFGSAPRERLADHAGIGETRGPYKIASFRRCLLVGAVQLGCLDGYRLLLGDVP